MTVTKIRPGVSVTPGLAPGSVASTDAAPIDEETSVERSRPYLITRDLCRIWGEERDSDDPRAGEPLAARTVWSTVWHATNPAGRYYGYPLPVTPEAPNDAKPRRGQHTQWWPKEGQTLAELELELRLWYRNRPPAGSGNPVGPPPVYGPDVVALVRARAEAGDTDQAIADKLAAQYGTTPAGKPFGPRVVEGIRKRNEIPGGASYRSRTASDD